MEMWINIIVGLHVVIALAIIGLGVLQHGKGGGRKSCFLHTHP